MFHSVGTKACELQRGIFTPLQMLCCTYLSHNLLQYVALHRDFRVLLYR